MRPRSASTTRAAARGLGSALVVLAVLAAGCVGVPLYRAHRLAGGHVRLHLVERIGVLERMHRTGFVAEVEADAQLARNAFVQDAGGAVYGSGGRPVAYVEVATALTVFDEAENERYRDSWRRAWAVAKGPLAVHRVAAGPLGGQLECGRSTEGRTACLGMDRHAVVEVVVFDGAADRTAATVRTAVLRRG